MGAVLEQNKAHHLAPEERLSGVQRLFEVEIHLTRDPHHLHIHEVVVADTKEIELHHRGLAVDTVEAEVRVVLLAEDHKVVADFRVNILT